MRRLAILLTALVLTACGAEEDLSQPPEAIGQFRLGHNIAIADNIQLGPFSRTLSEDTIEGTVQSAVAERLRRYDGNGLYHLGLNVGGLVLAQPGIPLIYSPNSVMIVDVTVFDNSTQSKLNEEPKRFVVGEGIRNTVPIIGSGYVRSAEDQLANVSQNFARQLEDWLGDNPEWFAPVDGQVKVPFEVATPVPPVVTETETAPETAPES